MSDYVCFAVYLFNVIISGAAITIISLIISAASKQAEGDSISPIMIGVSFLSIGGLITWIMKLYGYL